MKDETKKLLYEKLVLYREERKSTCLLYDKLLLLMFCGVAVITFFGAIAMTNSKPLHIETVVIDMGMSIIFCILFVFGTLEFYRDADRWNKAIKNAEALYNEVVGITESTKK